MPNEAIDKTVGSKPSQLNSDKPQAPAAVSAAAESPTQPPEATSTQPTDPSLSTAASTSKPPVSPQEDKLSSKFAAMARKERQVVAKQQELKAEEARISVDRAKAEAELSKSKQELESQLKEIKDFQALKKANPIKALEALGFTYQQLTDMVLQNDGKPTAEQLIEQTKSEMESRFEAMERKREEESARKAKEAEEASKKALEDEKQRLEAEQVETINQFKSEINDFISQNQDAYELISLNDSQEIIFATVERHFEQTNRVLSIKEASDLVEQYLEDQVQKNLASKKYKAKVSPPSPKEEPQVTPKATFSANQSQSPKTITNDMTSRSTSSPAMTERERMQRALDALSRVAS